MKKTIFLILLSMLLITTCVVGCDESENKLVFGRISLYPELEGDYSLSTLNNNVLVDGSWVLGDGDKTINIPAIVKEISLLWRDGNPGRVYSDSTTFVSESADVLPVYMLMNETGFFAYVETSGEYVTDFKYISGMPEFSFDRYICVQDDKGHGVLDTVTGEEIIPCVFSNPLYFYENLAPAEMDGKFGFIDLTGKFQISPQYDFVYPFTDNKLAAVVEDGKVGFIDTDGNAVISSDFHQTESQELSPYDISNEKLYTFHDGLAAVETETGIGLIESDGTFFVEPVYSDVRWYRGQGFKLSRTSVENRNATDFCFVDSSKVKLEITTQANTSCNYIGGRYILDRDKVNGEIVLYRNGKEAKRIADDIIRIQGELTFLEDDRFMVRVQGRFDSAPGSVGVYSLTDGWLFTHEAANCYITNPGYIMLITSDSKMGLVDFRGEVAIEPSFEFLKVYGNRVLTIKDGKQEYVDISVER